MMVGCPGRYLGKNLAYSRACISVPDPAPIVTIEIVFPAKETEAEVGVGVAFEEGLVVDGEDVATDVGGATVGVDLAAGLELDAQASNKMSKSETEPRSVNILPVIIAPPITTKPSCLSKLLDGNGSWTVLNRCQRLRSLDTTFRFHLSPNELSPLVPDHCWSI